MAKRNWPDHPSIGKSVTFNGISVVVVDVKAGPMFIDTSSFDKPTADITETLQLRVRYPGGAEVWTPPMDGNSFVDWCAKQNADDSKEGS